MTATIRPSGQFPSGSVNKPTLPQLSTEQLTCLHRAKQYAMQENVKHVLKKQQMQAGLLPGATTSIESQNQAMQLQRQQALVLMCRVYVGSIFYDLREEFVRTSFAAFGTIRSINMSFDPITGKHKGFAFIEYETPDAAQMAMEQMTGVLMSGRPIKVGRPSNMPQSHPIIDKILEESESSKRIYVSSIHEDLSTEDVKSVFSAFGDIVSCVLAPDPTSGKHKGYGSIEYKTLQSAKDAISSMNLFDLGGQNLRVGRGIGPLPPTLQGNNLASNLIGVPSTPKLEPIVETKPQIPTIPVSALSTPPVATVVPTVSSVIKLGNMVNDDEVDEDLERDVTEECSKYGTVEKVVIYKEKQGEKDIDPCIVKIFVKFTGPPAAQNAINNLDKRWFGGRQTQAEFYPEAKFVLGNYSG